MAQSTIRIGTRGSKLALVQANQVAHLLGAPSEIVVVKTTGDIVQDKSLADIGGKALFVKELEEQLLAGAIDLAVHSMKDVPVDLPKGLAIGAVLEREDPRDVFISNEFDGYWSLPEGSRVGTCSVRRQAQMKHGQGNGLVVVPMRGNVDTRLAKLDAGEVDAIILAYAGLKRLGLESRVTEFMDQSWLPALSQGAVGIEIREDDAQTLALVAPLNHRRTALELACERAFQAELGGTCRSPIAGRAEVNTGYATPTISFEGQVLASDDSREDIRQSVSAALVGDAETAAAQVGREIGADFKKDPRVLQWLAA
jgi:hydroxymethylbilane synthase